MEIVVHPGPTCPRCHKPEVLLGGTVRPFKVLVDERIGWESHCTECDIWFTDEFITEYKENGTRYRVDVTKL